MDHSALNRLIYEQLELQWQNLGNEIAEPLFLQYGRLLEEYKKGYVLFNDEEGIDLLLEERAADIGAENPYAIYMERTEVNERKAIDRIREHLLFCFADTAIQEQLKKSGAILFSYDWYFHYDSGINFFKKEFTYPIILEPRYLNQDLPPDHYDGFAKGPDFAEIWPDCSAIIEEYEEDDLLDLGSKLMNYYQLQSRLYIHKALYEMDIAGELAVISNTPFLFYVSQHDCEDMTLYCIG